MFTTHASSSYSSYMFSSTDNLVHINGLTDNHIFIQGLIHLVIEYIYIHTHI